MSVGVELGTARSPPKRSSLPPPSPPRSARSRSISARAQRPGSNEKVSSLSGRWSTPTDAAALGDATGAAAGAVAAVPCRAGCRCWCRAGWRCRPWCRQSGARAMVTSSSIGGAPCPGEGEAEAEGAGAVAGERWRRAVLAICLLASWGVRPRRARFGFGFKLGLGLLAFWGGTRRAICPGQVTRLCPTEQEVGDQLAWARRGGPGG